MKKVIKLVVAVGITAGVVFSGLYAIAGDRFLPWVAREAVYVATSQAVGQKNPGGGYNYQSDYVSQSGKKGKIDFYAPRKLRQGAYIKLDAKGNYVASWEEVSASELPTVVSNQLN